MADDPDGSGAVGGALNELIASIAHRSARAAHELGVEFDLEDPRVARWLMSTTFDAMFMPSTARANAELLGLAAQGLEPESGTAPDRPARRGARRPLVTWDDLVASAPDAIG